MVLSGDLGIMNNTPLRDIMNLIPSIEYITFKCLMDSVERERENMNTFPEVVKVVRSLIQLRIKKKNLMCQSTLVQHIKISPLESLD